MNIFAITTFPSVMYEVYAKDMIKSFAKNFPESVPLIIQLDDSLVVDDVKSLLRPQDAVAVGWNKDHVDFVERNKNRDSSSDYRKQGVRFCHKIFAIKRAMDAALAAKEAKDPSAPRYLMWIDADTLITSKVTIDDLMECIPKNGDAVSFLGRKDWPHSECGFLIFDLENEGDIFIKTIHGLYVADEVWKLDEWHDSYVFDYVRKSKGAPGATNLTEDKPGMDIWMHSPMSRWSIHKKGPVNKGLHTQAQPPQMPKNRNFVVQTKNSIADEKIQSNIIENQKLIKNWIVPCTKTDEQIVVVSAGPSLIPELDVLDDYKSGKKIVAVKHSLDSLKMAGIKPWACILLDPREHVNDFVEDPDQDILWFVASQVNPRVTEKLLAKNCTVWGYHAAVGAGEEHLILKQPNSIISGGSATSTRGLFLLNHLGFYKMKLVAYDLCFFDKVDTAELDDLKQPKYMEISIQWQDPVCNLKRMFYTKPEFIAQFEEMNQIITTNLFDLEATGDGIIPFVLRYKKGGEMRRDKTRIKVDPVSYERLLNGTARKR